eukprot:TRINITY_DN1380_c0_g1_i1.p1 TRINITY_DN1380_c0_g1~~TRINITY_DN1380_c0_g1_i1.p1  ORF type:complete len:435 (+),score=74.41 TRINITY_DN1380_c0_g1_i1:378-1682(+)
MASSLEQKWILPLTIASIISLLLFFLTTVGLGLGPASLSMSGDIERDSSSLLQGTQKIQVLEGEVTTFADGNGSVVDAQPSGRRLPVLAYSISGGKGDVERMKRLLLALYHPHNEYILHLDLDAPPKERIDLTRFIRMDSVFMEVGNVHMVLKANLVTYRGVTMLTTYLHCAAILLQKRRDWDWYINLSASDYPLVSQDDFLHVLASVPLSLNFVDHSSNLGMKEHLRARPIVVDPALYSSTKSELFFASQKRSIPTAFKLFDGSAWVMLSRAFVEYVIWGWDNLPRLALMYYTNYVSSPEGYFQTVICNSREFRNTTVNHDLHYIEWDVPAMQHPRVLGMKDYPIFSIKGLPFARKFNEHDEVLNKIDRELLGRARWHFTPGAWCVGSSDDGKDACWELGDFSRVRPTNASLRLQAFMKRILSSPNFREKQCI